MTVVQKSQTALAESKVDDLQLSLPHQIQLDPRGASNALQPHREMLYKAQRTNTAVNAMVAVMSHAQRQLEAGAKVMLYRLKNVDDYEPLEQFMGTVTYKCLAMMQSAVLALAESLPARLGEEL